MSGWSKNETSELPITTGFDFKETKLMLPAFPTVAETLEVLRTIHERPGTTRTGIYDKLEELAIAHLERAFDCHQKENQ